MVLLGHLHLETLRNPLQKLLKDKEMALDKKKEELLIQTGKHQYFYMQAKGDSLFSSNYSNKMEEQLQLL